VEELETNRDLLLESMAGMVSEALDVYTGEGRTRIYRMLQLEVTPTTEGYDISGSLCTSATRPAPTRGPGRRAPSRCRISEGLENVGHIVSGETVKVAEAAE
jgi:hypothetical protein